MPKQDLSKVPTVKLLDELNRRGEKEQFAIYVIDLNEAFERVVNIEQPDNKPRRFKTLKGQERLRKQIWQEANNELADLFHDTEVSFWNCDYNYDDFFVDEKE